MQHTMGTAGVGIRIIGMPDDSVILLGDEGNAAVMFKNDSGGITAEYYRGAIKEPCGRHDDFIDRLSGRINIYGRDFDDKREADEEVIFEALLALYCGVDKTEFDLTVTDASQYTDRQIDELIAEATSALRFSGENPHHEGGANCQNTGTSFHWTR